MNSVNRPNNAQSGKMTYGEVIAKILLTNESNEETTGNKINVLNIEKSLI